MLHLKFVKYVVMGSFLLFISVIGQNVGAQQVDYISVKQAWSRSTPPMAKNGAVYFSILNTGPADQLIGVSTTVAKRSTLHMTKMASGPMKGVLRMQGLSAIPLPAGQSFTAKPGGHHIMLMGLKKPLKTGNTFNLTLTFKKAGKMTVSVTVRK